MNHIKLKNLLTEDEGLKLFPYRDTVGKLTIGVGRNLDDVGISRAEAMFLLDNDIQRSIVPLLREKWFGEINEVRKAVVISMVFNLGHEGFKGFKNLRRCLAAHDYLAASAEMLKSKWAFQVGDRAVRLSEMMKFGEWI